MITVFFNLSVTHSLKSSILLTQKCKQPYPVQQYVLALISDISFWWTLGNNTSFFGRNIFLSTLLSRIRSFCTFLQREIPVCI